MSECIWSICFSVQFVSGHPVESFSHEASVGSTQFVLEEAKWTFSAFRDSTAQQSSVDQRTMRFLLVDSSENKERGSETKLKTTATPTLHGSYASDSRR